MYNTFYVLSKGQIAIERLHICTWEFPHASSYIEFGMEFLGESFDGESIEFHLAVPLVRESDEVYCLFDNLSDKDNARFIFNDVVTAIRYVGKDPREGCILEFETRGKLTLLPCFSIKVHDGLICLKIKKPNKYEENSYCRILVKLGKRNIAIKKSGIAQTTYTYDIQINEKRNIPQKVYNLKDKESLEICEVKQLYCLHALPDDFAFSFIDTSKLKNIRKLESSAFQKYLPKIKGIKKDCYNIMFLKDNDQSGNKGSYSLFSVCAKETIGTQQLALAVGVNILCNFLFAFSHLEFKGPCVEWCHQVPWEYWVALGVVVLLLLFRPLKSLFIYLFRSLKTWTNESFIRHKHYHPSGSK